MEQRDGQDDDHQQVEKGGWQQRRDNKYISNAPHGIDKG